MLDIIDKGQLLSIYTCKLEIVCYEIKVIKDPLTDSTKDHTLSIFTICAASKICVVPRALTCINTEHIFNSVAYSK